MNFTNEKKIKVLFLAKWYPNEDSQMHGIFIKRHAQSVSLFCDVCVLYIHYGTKRPKTIIEYSIEDKIKIIRVYPKSIRFRNKIFQYLNFFINSYKGMKIVKKEFGRPHIIHVNVALPMGILAVGLDLFKDIPYVVTEHFTGFTGQTKKFFNFFQLKIILKRAKYICPVSTTLKKTMEKFYQTDKYQIIPNIINTEIFFPEHLKKRNLKKQIIHVSTLKKEHKNISGIIYAIHKISKIRKDFEMHIIGDGYDRNNLENLCIQLGIKDSIVFFHGFVSDSELGEYLRNSDFFILNSNYETFSVACAEALASGIPVISTRCGGPEDFITENVGILIEKGNQQKLIDAILYMLSNSDKYDPKKLHNYIEKKFGIDIIGKQIYDIYFKSLKKQ
jgi:glycosyltransferase involved in cell wall biosynthesis